MISNYDTMQAKTEYVAWCLFKDLFKIRTVYLGKLKLYKIYKMTGRHESTSLVGGLSVINFFEIELALFFIFVYLLQFNMRFNIFNRLSY